LDPSPLVGRDLDERIESYILDCAREMPATGYSLVLHVPDSAMPDSSASGALSEAVRTYFAYRRDEQARRLRLLMSEGRQALIVGLAFLFICGALGLVALKALPTPLGAFLNEGLLIIGWVANWRPVEIFLYDWRPLRREWKVMDALSRMPIQFRATGA